MPPDAFTFAGMVPTSRCWLARCPACLEGWCAVLPDGSRDGYRLAAEIGCSTGCDVSEVAWWHAWRNGELPQREPVEATEAGRRYLAAAVRNAVRRVAEASDPLARLKREAYELAGLAVGMGIDPAAIVRALAVAARHAGVPAELALPTITNNTLAGANRPRRMPS